MADTLVERIAWEVQCTDQEYWPEGADGAAREILKIVADAMREEATDFWYAAEWLREQASE